MGSTSVKSTQNTPLNIAIRVLAAIVGGYLLTNIVAILFSYLLPLSQGGGVMTAMLVSFAFYAGAVIWVFSVKTAFKAWLGLLALGVPSAAWLYVMAPDLFVFMPKL